MPNCFLITLEYPSFAKASEGTAPTYGGVANYYHGIVAHWPYGNLEVLHVKLGRMWPRWLSVFFEVRSSAKGGSAFGGKIDLLQVGQALPLGYVALLVKWLHGIPYLVYTHGMDVLVPQESWHKKLLLKLILKQAKIVVANSEFTKHEVVKLGIAPEKVVVVYPCPDIQFAEVEPLFEVRPLNIKPVILTVSRLVPRKGIDTVLAALPEVIKKIPHVQYVVIGDGPALKNLQLITQNLQLQSHVQFLGAISDEEKIAWYKKACLFVLVPRPLGGDIEGFGTVYLEANSFGLPVVGSRTGGVPEAVQDNINGLLVEPNNPQQTAEALIQLLTNQPLADTLGVQGQERVNKEFIWETQLQKLFNALSQ